MIVKSMVIRIARIEHFIVSHGFIFPIHNKKNGRTALKPNKIKGFRVF